jgi:hypothetical protein
MTGDSDLPLVGSYVMVQSLLRKFTKEQPTQMALALQWRVPLSAKGQHEQALSGFDYQKLYFYSDLCELMR